MLVKSTIPKSQIGIMPGCFQRNVTSYIGFLSKINEIEILNEKGRVEKAQTKIYALLDIIGLNINSKTICFLAVLNADKYIYIEDCVDTVNLKC